MRHILIVGALLLAAASIVGAMPCLAEENARWYSINNGIDEIDMITVAVNPRSPAIFYAGSGKSIFKSIDAGDNWQKVYLVRGNRTAVNVFAFDPLDNNKVYAGTQNGLFMTNNGGADWNRIFDGAGGPEKEIRHMIIDSARQGRMFVGTGSGLFTTGDSGRTWNKLPGQISDQTVNYIAQDPLDPGALYCATLIGVFKSSDGGLTWDRIFAVTGQSAETEIEDVSQDTDTDETAGLSNKTPNCLAINKNGLYAGTDCGVFVSRDAGRSWDKLTGSGLINKKISSIVCLPDGSLCAATEGGVFIIVAPFIRWDELYNGLESKQVPCLAYDRARNSVIAATKKGLFHIALSVAAKERVNIPDSSVADILKNIESEPAIQEIQAVAIKYAEVNKEKIDAWRSAAQKKAALPNVSVGVEKYLTDYYHWDSGTNPDTLQKGKAPTDWSVTLSWDLGELVWNNDQTSIDTRSRLMVQLRDDILDEVTRLYFERRRLQIELLTNPPKNIQTRLEKDLRLQELTAGIDALTGGYLSKIIGGRSPKGHTTHS